MRYGRFDDDAREYVITRPDTPLPWINYLGSEDYFGIISNTGGGYSFYRDARLRRLTRYRYNNAPLDLGGRYLYLRDDEDGDYWSPSWQPVQRALDWYECRHGMGYTMISGRRRGIRAETAYVVPLGETLEQWRVRVTNERPVAASLSLFGTVEFCLWDANDDATNFQRNYSIGEVEIEPGVIYHKSEYRERRDHFAYFACSEPDTGFDTQRDAFTGAYRGWDRPLAVEGGACTGSIASGWQPIGAHQVRLRLEPGETRDVVFVLGYAENPATAKFDPPGSQVIDKRRVRPVIERHLRPDMVDEALAGLRDRWDELLDGLRVHTGSEHVDRMVNAWNAYQCMTTFNLSRSASMYESGIGRGLGFRDSAQDLLGFVHMIPDRARSRLLDLASTQLPSGGAYHQYQPLTKRGNDAVGTGFNDDPLWLVIATAAYLRETGDLAILDEPAPYYSRPGGAEAVVIAGLFLRASREMSQIAERRGDRAEVARCMAGAARLRRAVHEHAWDGAWFLRAYDSTGSAVGASDCDEGQMYVEPQGLCVMAGVGLEDGRAATALASVRGRLATPHGIVLLDPPYTHYSPLLGEISSYPPGYKENGAVFCHANPWVMIAETRLGHGDAALDYYLRTCPSAREAISDVHRCEPYVHAQMIAGRASPSEGEAKNSWLTGTAAWNFVAVTQWILGIRPELDGLRVDPVLPADWGDVEVTRRYRGTTYRIAIRKRRGMTGRVCDLVVDGRPIPGTLVPIPAVAGEVMVEAVVLEPA